MILTSHRKRAFIPDTPTNNKRLKTADTTRDIPIVSPNLVQSTTKRELDEQSSDSPVSYPVTVQTANKRKLDEQSELSDTLKRHCTDTQHTSTEAEANRKRKSATCDTIIMQYNQQGEKIVTEPPRKKSRRRRGKGKKGATSNNANVNIQPPTTTEQTKSEEVAADFNDYNWWKVELPSLDEGDAMVL